MTLISLSLENFQGFRRYQIEPKGQDCLIRAQNGLGKTTLMSAATFLLLGVDSLGRKPNDFDIKLKVQGETQHKLQHSVEGVFDVDGQSLTLKRTWQEKWPTHRGAAAETFSGHETLFWVNGVPSSEQEYNGLIAERIAPLKRLRMLMVPTYFLEELDWKERRAILLDVVGDITDADVIARSPKLKGLPDVLGSHKLEDYRKVLAAQKTKLNAELGQIPPRIQENQRSIVGVPQGDHEAEQKRLNAEVEALRKERLTLDSGGKSAELRREIADLDTQMIQVRNNLLGQVSPDREAALKARHAVCETLDDWQLHLSSLERLANGNIESLNQMDTDLAALRVTVKNMRDELDALRALAPAASEGCPACGQPLPEDQVQESIERFNQKKARDIDTAEKQISEKVELGKAKRATRDALEVSIKADLEKAAALRADIDSAQADYDNMEVPMATFADPETDPQYKTMTSLKAKKQTELDSLAKGSEDALEALDAKILGVQILIGDSQKWIALLGTNATATKRIAELEAEEKQLSAQYQKADKELALCEEFVRQKVALLTDSINQRFSLTRFRLFEQQVNGGLQDICECLHREAGAPPSHGQAVQCGLDCIAVLSQHYGVRVPIWIDNSESVTRLPQTGAQQIRLIHDEDAAELKVEYRPTTHAALPSPAHPKELACATTKQPDGSLEF